MFAGCTLWSDIDDGVKMNDFKYTFNNYTEYRDLHQEHVNWLSNIISNCVHPLVVVTHHLPSFQAIAPRYREQNNTAYASNLDHLFRHPLIAWVCGHTHEPLYKLINDIPLIINSVGYPLELIFAQRKASFTI